MILSLLIALAVAPPAPPGASWRVVEVVTANFEALGTAESFSPDRRTSIAGVFSSYTGVATADIYVSVEDVADSEISQLQVEHVIPQGTAGASIAHALNNGIMSDAAVLQSALVNTGGTIVYALGLVELTQRNEVVYPPPGPGPPFSQTLIIVFAIAGIVALIVLVFLARYCDADRLRETRKLIASVLVRIRGGNGTKQQPQIVVVRQTPPPSTGTNDEHTTTKASGKETGKEKGREEK